MRTSTAFKIERLAATFRAKHIAYIRVAGVPEELPVRNLRKHGHSVEFELDRGRGFIVIDPDDITLVRLHRMPKPAGDEAI